MQNIIKVNTPNFFEKIIENKNIVAWKNLDKMLFEKTDISIKEKLRKYILENEQNNRCVYCESKINYFNNKSHIEHIKPKDKYPKEFKDYNNLVVSCNNKNTCGIYKGNNYKDFFINPILENPEEYLTYDLMTGEIISREIDINKKEKADYTIEVLNLNFSKLKDARARFILEADKMKEYLEYLDEFPSLIKELKNNI